MADKDIVYQIDANADRAIASIRQFNAEIEKVSATGQKAFGGIERTGGQKVRQLGFALQRFGITGTAAFGEIFAAAGVAGLALGGILVSVTALTKAFISLGNFAKETITAMVKGAIDIRKEYELAELQFTAIFDGSERAGEAAVRRLKELSKELGSDVLGVGRAFLPEVESLDQLEEITKISVALSRFQPEQGALGARIALQEALGGEFRSLRRRFEFSPQAIEKIENAFEETGIAGLIEAINEELERTGRDLEALSDSFDVHLGRAQETVRQLGDVMGEPIVDALKSQLAGINELLADAEPFLEQYALQIGNIVAAAAEFAGDKITEFLAGLDPKEIASVLDSLQSAIASISAVIDLLVNAEKQGQGTLTLLDALFGGIDLKFQKLAKNIAYFKALMAGLGPILSGVLAIAQAIVAPGTMAVPLTEYLGNLENPIDAYNASIQESNELWETHQKRVEESQKAVEELKKEQAAGDDPSADVEADTILKSRRLGEDIAAINSQIPELEEKIEEERNKFAARAASKRLEIEKKAIRDRMDIMIRHGRRMLDIETKRLEDITDAYRNHLDKIEDAEIELTRDEADIARDQARKRLDIERDEADDRIEIIKDYIRKVAELRRQFEFDSQEAIRANDAITFLRLRRQLEFDLKEAEIDRDEGLDDVVDKAEDRREELQRIQEEELEDARLANKRRLEDLQRSLARRLDEIEINAQRERDAQLLALQRAREDYNTEQQRINEDYNDWWRERYAITEQGVEDEVEQLNRLLEERTNLMNQLNAIAANTVHDNWWFGVTGVTGNTNRYFNVPGNPSAPGYFGATGANTSGGYTYNNVTNNVTTFDYQADQIRRLQLLASNILVESGLSPAEIEVYLGELSDSELRQLVGDYYAERREHGGPVKAGYPYRVGERGEETVVFPRDGYVFPFPRQMFFSPPGQADRVVSKGGGGSTQINEFSFPMLEPDQVTPRLKNVLRNMIAEVMLEAEL